jgi:threonine dehydratase
MTRIEAAGAEVIEHGVSLLEADECARALAAAREDAAYVPPFDHELIWEGKWVWSCCCQRLHPLSRHLHQKL